MQNGFIESFNGRMRDELLNETLFFNLDRARRKIAARATDYNSWRPHSPLGYFTPVAFAANLTAIDDQLRNPASFADRQLLYPRQRAQNMPRL